MHDASTVATGGMTKRAVPPLAKNNLGTANSTSRLQKPQFWNGKNTKLCRVKSHSFAFSCSNICIPLFQLDLANLKLANIWLKEKKRRRGSQNGGKEKNDQVGKEPRKD